MSMLDGYDNQTVQLRRYLKSDAYGKPVYSDPEPIPCRLQYDRKLVRNDKGETVVSEAGLYTVVEVGALDAITIDGRDVRAVSISRKVDLDGRYDHTEVRL